MHFTCISTSASEGVHRPTEATHWGENWCLGELLPLPRRQLHRPARLELRSWRRVDVVPLLPGATPVKAAASLIPLVSVVVFDGVG
jgi:hypothetical protein